MKLVVENVGRIEKAEIEIRPLTVFIGENGTNKTWTAMGLFALLAQLRARGGQRTHVDAKVKALLDSCAREFVEKAEQTAGGVQQSFERSTLIDALPHELRFWLDSPQLSSAIGTSLHPRARMDLVLDRAEFADGVTSHLALDLQPKPYRLKRDRFDRGSTTPLSSTNYGSTVPNPKDDVRAALEELLFSWKWNVRALPVERELLSQTYLQLLVSKIGLLPALIDFCDLLAMAEHRATMWPNQPEGELRQFVRQVIGGSFRFTGSPPRLVFELRENSADEPLPVAATASMQKSLAGLDVLLDSASRGDILIIDEPELSAHPEAQVKLVELFALMIRAGIQLVIVTHSPYIVDHISTIIEMSRLDPQQRARAAASLALKNPESYLKPDEVAVWQFNKDGKVTSVYDEENGSIDWSTFTKVTKRESIAINRILDEAEGGAGKGA